MMPEIVMMPSAYIFELRRRVLSLYGRDSKERELFWELTDKFFDKSYNVQKIKEAIRKDKGFNGYRFLMALSKSAQDIAFSSSKSPEC